MNYQEELQALIIDYNELVHENERLTLDTVYYQRKCVETLDRLHQCKRRNREDKVKLRKQLSDILGVQVF